MATEDLVCDGVGQQRRLIDGCVGSLRRHRCRRNFSKGLMSYFFFSEPSSSGYMAVFFLFLCSFYEFSNRSIGGVSSEERELFAENLKN